MKNALLLLGIWAGIIVFAYGVVYWDGGGPLFSGAAASESTVSVVGVVRTPVPSGWRVEIADDWVRMVDPQGDLTVLVGGGNLAAPDLVAQEAWSAAFGERFPAVWQQTTVFVSGRTGERLESDGGGYAIVWTAAEESIFLLVRGTGAALERESRTLAELENGLAFGDEAVASSPVLMEL